MYFIFSFATDRLHHLKDMNPNVCDPRRNFPTLPLYMDSGKVEPEADKQRMQPGAVEGRRGVWVCGREIRLDKRNHVERCGTTG